MANVMVNELNLVAIGDALRSRLGETKTFNGTMTTECVPKISKTPNALSATDFSGDGYSLNQELVDVVTIPNATRLKVVITYKTTHHTQSNYLCVMNGNHTNVSDFNNATQYKSNSALKMVTLYFDNTDTVSFLFATGSLESGYLGYYAEVVAVDADGEVAVIEQTFDNLEIPNTFKPREMADAIYSIPSGGDIEISVVTGSVNSMFANGTWDWVITEFGNQITTENITSAVSMFYQSKVSEIPFTINFDASSGADANCMFQRASNLTKTPKMTGIIYNADNMFNYCSNLEEIDFTNLKGRQTNTNVGTNIQNMFSRCSKLKTLTGKLQGYYYSPQNLFFCCPNLREIPESFFEDAEYNSGSYWNSGASIFQECYSLRNIPSSFYAFLKQGGNTSNWNTGYSGIYYYTFYGCRALEEIKDYPIYTNIALDSNNFDNFVNHCSRLKTLTFDTNEDGTPLVAKWSNQVIDLSTYTGWAINTIILDYNSGITEETRGVYQSSSATPHAQYNSVKDSPDFWTTEVGYSRYNHQSAVETINSLPDTSAYLATAGGTNTIKFKRLAANYTDEGIEDKLTEAEIAVATAKGWTVTLV